MVLWLWECGTGEAVVSMRQRKSVAMGEKGCLSEKDAGGMSGFGVKIQTYRGRKYVSSFCLMVLYEKCWDV